MTRDTILAWVLGPPILVLYVLFLGNLLNGCKESWAAREWSSMAVLLTMFWMATGIGVVMLCLVIRGKP